MAVKLRSLTLNLPFGLGGVELEVSEAEARAAWHLYVEFATRVTAHSLEPGAGSVREALDSVYALFGITRHVLQEAGPEVAKRGPDALGPLAIRVLNEGIRPFLVAWHTELRVSGHSLDTGGEISDERRLEFDQELGRLQVELAKYVDALAQVAGIHSSPSTNTFQEDEDARL